MPKNRKAKYQKRINSGEWFSKHKNWLGRSWGFCSLLPFIPIGKWGKSNFSYQMHHMNYSTEIYGVSIIALSPFSHKFIIHGLLGGFQGAGKQGNFPNAPQTILHMWCRLHILIKWAVMIFTFTAGKDVWQWILKSFV